MTGRLHREDPLTPGEREEFEEDLITFCDRELDLLGNIRGLDVLYAGGSSPLWIEGLSQRTEESGSVTVLDPDGYRIEEARASLSEADLAAPVRLLTGNVFGIPFDSGTFDLVYSAGLLHELDVGERTAREALAALRYVARPGARVATSDFVDPEPAVQIQDEQLEAELRRKAYGKRSYGIGPPERLIALHEELLSAVRWQLSPPRTIRHLGKIVLAEEDPEELSSLPPAKALTLRRHRTLLRDRIRREGYTRPATLYLEGLAPDHPLNTLQRPPENRSPTDVAC